MYIYISCRTANRTAEQRCITCARVCSATTPPCGELGLAGQIYARTIIKPCVVLPISSSTYFYHIHHPYILLLPPPPLPSKALVAPKAGFLSDNHQLPTTFPSSPRPCVVCVCIACVRVYCVQMCRERDRERKRERERERE